MPDPPQKRVTGLFSPPQSLPKPPIITQMGGESPISVFEYYTLKTLVKYYALKTLVKYVTLKSLVK